MDEDPGRVSDFPRESRNCLLVCLFFNESMLPFSLLVLFYYLMDPSLFDKAVRVGVSGGGEGEGGCACDHLHFFLADE